MSGDGSAWVDCQCGARHWGIFGAAGLLLRTSDDRVLMQLRAGWSHHGGTWSLPGGARDSHERPVEAALRETFEETGIDPGVVEIDGVMRTEHGSWRYDTVFGYVPDALAVTATDESDALEWVPASEVAQLPLHPALAVAWTTLLHPGTHAVVDLRDSANQATALEGLEELLARGWGTGGSPVVRVTALVGTDAMDGSAPLASLVERRVWSGRRGDLGAWSTGRHRAVVFTDDLTLAEHAGLDGFSTASLSEAIDAPR